MNNKDLLNAIGDSDGFLIERSERKPSGARRFVKWGSLLAACLAIAICATAFLPKLIGARSEIGTTGDILVISEKVPVTYSGVEITEAEALEKLESVKNEIFAAFLPEAESGEISEIEICTHGYRHITFDSKNNIALDYIDYPVMSGGKAVGIIKLYRTDSEICYTLSYGGEGISKLFETVSGSPEKSYVAAYLATSIEVLISSDNEIICINGGVAEGTFEKNVDYYSAFSADGNVICAETFNTSDAITVSE